MQKVLGALSAVLLLAWSTIVLASHTYEIVELYTNADGSIQFVLLQEYAGNDGQDFLAGDTLTATHAGRTKVYTFPNDLPSPRTAGRYVLIATQGYVDAEQSYSEFANVPADYVMPDRFLPTDGGTVSYAGVDTVTYGGLPSDGESALFTPSNAGQYVATNQTHNFAGSVSILPALAVAAVEYYSAALDHYFISDLAPDIDALDSGRIPGWIRTGLSFYVYADTAAGLSPVCRFYIPPQHGNSHFFSASPAECAAISSRIGFDPNYSGYVLETSAAFYVDLPDTGTGACPSGTSPVYRLWNGRPDSNHRYTTDLNVRAQMIARGYIPEGYGVLGVAMCAPV